MKTKHHKIINCYYCVYNKEGDRDKKKSICRQCKSFDNFVDLREGPPEEPEWPIEKELIGGSD